MDAEPARDRVDLLPTKHHGFLRLANSAVLTLQGLSACLRQGAPVEPSTAGMISRLSAYWATVALIWVLALWHSWTARGLFVDGANFLVHIVRQESLFDFYMPRLYAMVLGQLPVMSAVTLGVTDLHLLARLLSLGLFVLPTVFYHLALHRAKDDPVLLAVVIAAIAIVFMTTSFFIVGEYNTLYAVVILIAVRLATAERLTLWDSMALLLLSMMAIRTYETMIYLGPLLAGIMLWKVWC